MKTDNGIEYDDMLITTTPIDCGDCVKTQYFNKTVLVRQDIKIIVAEGVLLGGEPGVIGA